MIDRDSGLDPFFWRRGLLVGANGGDVDHLDVAVVRSGDGVDQSVPHTCLSPSHEAVVAGGARAIALRQVAPLEVGQVIAAHADVESDIALAEKPMLAPLAHLRLVGEGHRRTTRRPQ